MVIYPPRLPKYLAPLLKQTRNAEYVRNTEEKLPVPTLDPCDRLSSRNMIGSSSVAWCIRISFERHKIKTTHYNWMLSLLFNCSSNAMNFYAYRTENWAAPRWDSRILNSGRSFPTELQQWSDGHGINKHSGLISFCLLTAASMTMYEHFTLGTERRAKEKLIGTVSLLTHPT